MTKAGLIAFYQRYIACLNAQDWDSLGSFVHPSVTHNGQQLGLAGYREMLINDYRVIPDLRFTIKELICDPPWIACRLIFDCTPENGFLGLEFNGQSVSFSENVFYQVREERIYAVFSVVDKIEIEKQLNKSGPADVPS